MKLKIFQTLENGIKGNLYQLFYQNFSKYILKLKNKYNIIMILYLLLFIVNIACANDCIEIGKFQNNIFYACPIQKLNETWYSNI